MKAYNKERKMKKSTTILAIALVGGLFTCQSTFAADYKTSLGLGVGMAPDYEGSEDYEGVPLFYGRVSWGDGDYVLLKGNQLKWNMLNDKVQFGPLLQYRSARDDVDNDQVDRMKDVDGATEAGLFLSGVFGPWKATVEFAADISGEYDGYLITLGGDYKTTVSEKLSMTFGATTTYASSDYMKTYFQVDAGNRGTSTLPDYSADDGELKDVGIHMVADYDINTKWSVSGNLAYTLLVGDAADSPIVDDEGNENQFFIGALAIYHF